MDLKLNIKAVLVALFLGFFNPYPTTAAAAVAVLAVLANFLGMLAALRRGEAVSGTKILRGNVRILLYFLTFSALYHAMKFSQVGMHILSGVYTIVALFEFFLLMQKAVELKIVPSSLLKLLKIKVDEIQRSDNNLFA